MAEIHGPNGLRELLIQSCNAMAEERLLLDYGDYLAVPCDKLTGPQFQPASRNVEKLNWVEVAAKIKAEELALCRYKEGIPFSPMLTIRPPTPFLDCVSDAATWLKSSEDQVLFEIKQYAARNEGCYIGVRKMIEEGRFLDLAERYLRDEISLERAFEGRPGEQILLRKVIHDIRVEWFLFAEWIDGSLHYRLTTKGMEKEDRLMDGSRR